MTPEEYWAYRAFTRDDAADEALSKSEVFQNYKQAELRREAELSYINEMEKVAEEDSLLNQIEDFERIVRASPELKNKLKQARDYIARNPDIEKTVDKNLVAGLNMLNLED